MQNLLNCLKDSGYWNLKKKDWKGFKMSGHGTRNRNRRYFQIGKKNSLAINTIGMIWGRKRKKCFCGELGLGERKRISNGSGSFQSWWSLQFKSNFKTYGLCETSNHEKWHPAEDIGSTEFLNLLHRMKLLYRHWNMDNMHVEYICHAYL